jgi:hypothetical protein
MILIEPTKDLAVILTARSPAAKVAACELVNHA